jgi:hypothetical protein
MGFNAASLPKDWDYSLRPFADVAGKMPLPSAEAMETFEQAQREALGADEDTSNAEMADLLDRLTGRQENEIKDRMAAATAELVGPPLTAEVLRGLPPYVVAKFLAALNRDVINPEA